MFVNVNGNFAIFERNFKFFIEFSRIFGQKFRKILALYISRWMGAEPPKQANLLKISEKSLETCNFC